MDTILYELDKYITCLDELNLYINFLEEDQNARFSDFKDIMYIGVINRSYSLWETFIKDVFYEYYLLNKDIYIQEKSIVQKYRIHELPSYVFNDVEYNNDSESIVFKLTKEVMTYTSKNMGIKELSNFFSRLDIKDIATAISSNKDVIELASRLEYIKDKVTDRATPINVMKRLLLERNLVSHTSKIEEFQSFDTLRDWVVFYKLLGSTIINFLCLNNLQFAQNEMKEIGKLVNVFNSNCLAVDIHKEIRIGNSTRMFVYSNDELIDIVKPISFMIEGKPVDEIVGECKAGILFESVLPFKRKVNKNHVVYIRDI